MFIGILALITIPVWTLLIYELIKPNEKHNNKKIILLTSFGTITTTILTVSLFQDFFIY